MTDHRLHDAILGMRRQLPQGRLTVSTHGDGHYCERTVALVHLELDGLLNLSC